MSNDNRKYSKAFLIKSNNNPFEIWLTYIGPQFNLTNREVKFGGLLLKYYKEIEKHFTDKNGNVTNREDIDTILFSTKYKKIIKEEANLSDNYFDVLLNKLRNHDIIISNNKLNPKIVPEYISGTSTPMLGLLIYIQ